MSEAKLINTSELTKQVDSGAQIEATAKRVENVDGYLLHLVVDGNSLTLSTYLSDNPRLFKRADALLKEATKIGIKSVTFITDTSDKG